MPTFNAYPSSRVRAPDVWGAMQRGREGAQINQMRQTKIQSGIAEQGRLAQLRAVMPGVGREAGLGESAQKALALDPSQLTTLMKIPQAERARVKEMVKVLSNFGMAILNAPGMQRPALDAEMRRVAAEYGTDPSKIPPLGDPGYEASLTSNIAKAGQIAAMLEQAEQATPPSGYRYAEGGLEHVPGGPADPAQAGRLATAKRGPEGGATPAQQANNREIDEARKRLREMEQKLEPGVSLTEEIHRRIGTTDSTTGRRILDFNTFLGRTAWMAMQRKVGGDQEQARWSRVLINPPEFSEPAGPKALPPGESAEQPGVFDSIRDFFTGGDNTPAPQPGAQQAAPARPQALDRFPGRALSPAPQPNPPRRGTPRAGGRARGRGGAKPIESMSQNEVLDLIYGNRPLSQDEINRLDARLNELGVERQEP